MSEKVKVPQWVANWLYVLMDNDVDDKSKRTVIRDILTVSWDGRLRDWLSENWETAIEAVLYGYESEGPKYLVKLLPRHYLRPSIVMDSQWTVDVNTSPSESDYWTVKEYTEFYNKHRELHPFLPPFRLGDPHFEKVEDDEDED